MLKKKAVTSAKPRIVVETVRSARAKRRFVTVEVSKAPRRKRRTVK